MSSGLCHTWPDERGHRRGGTDLQSAMRHSFQAGADEQGSALVLAVVAIVVVTAFSAIVLTGLLQTMRRSNDSARRIVCGQLAEAGLEKAIASLRADPVYYRGEEGTSLGAGQFTVSVQPGAGSRAFRIISTATLTEGPPTQAVQAASIKLGPDGRVQSLRWEKVAR